jgi:hypothetical protein
MFGDERQHGEVDGRIIVLLVEVDDVAMCVDDHLAQGLAGTTRRVAARHGG